MNMIGFYHGKLRDTYRFPSRVETNDDFLEKLKDETFGESTTYSSISEKSQLMVASLRKWKGQPYSVYTYFISSRDAANRLGGYVAITIIVQDYLVNDREKMYSIFEEAYSKLQLERVLDNSQILIEDFDEKKSFLVGLMDDIITCVKNNCGPFDPIPQYRKEGEPSAFNVKDCNGKAFINALKKSGIIYISRNFTSMIENDDYKKKYEEALATIERLKQRNISQSPATVSTTGAQDSAIKNLQTEKEELEKQNAALKEQIANVKAAIGTVDKNVQKTKDTVAKSAIKVLDSKNPWIKFSIVFPLVNTILLFVLLYLVSITLCGLKKNYVSESGKDGAAAQEQIMSNPVVDTSTEVQSNEAVNETEESGTNSVQIVQVPSASGQLPKTKDVKITVTNNKGAIVSNNTTVNPNDLLTVSCNDTSAKE